MRAVNKTVQTYCVLWEIMDGVWNKCRPNSIEKYQQTWWYELKRTPYSCICRFACEVWEIWQYRTPIGSFNNCTNVEVIFRNTKEIQGLAKYKNCTACDLFQLSAVFSGILMVIVQLNEYTKSASLNRTKRYSYSPGGEKLMFTVVVH